MRKSARTPAAFALPIENNHRRTSARWAARLLLASGLLTIGNNYLPGSGHLDRMPLNAIGVVSVVLGVVVARLPWGSWPLRAQLVLVPTALSLIALANLLGGVSSYSYAVYFVVLFVWVGLSQPPNTSFLLIPPAAAAYVVPGLLAPLPDLAAVSSVTVAVPVCVLVAEAIAHAVRTASVRGELLHVAAMANATQAGQNLAVARRLEEAEEEVKAMTVASRRDDLTGVGNRRHANSLLDSLDPGDAVLLVDLDRFKDVNDTHGHLTGDEVLAGLGAYLNEHLRDGDGVARYGGEEFVVVLREVGDGAAPVAQRLVDGWRALGPLTTISGGLAVHREQSWQATLEAADGALYEAKRSGRDRLCIARTVGARLEEGLRQAIQQGELEVHYQPIVGLESRRVLGLEALVRWNHPERGRISPAEFIPMAERLGLIRDIFRFVLGTASDQVSRWSSELGLASNFYVTVNVSPHQFDDGRLVDDVKAALVTSGMAPDRLVLEITEGALVTEVERTTRILEALRATGVRIAIDDFGTGYSSLAYLEQLPVDILKVDRLFTSQLERPNARAVTEAVVSLARSLKLDVVAEGVEGIGQIESLQAVGCHLGQGYHFSRPLPADAMTEFLSRPGAAGGSWTRSLRSSHRADRRSNRGPEAHDERPVPAEVELAQRA